MLNHEEVILLSNLGITKDQLEGSLDELSELLSAKLNDYNSIYEQGIQEVSDIVYDKLKGILRKIKPDAEVLDELYNVDYEEVDNDKDRYLIEVPLKSIKTIKSLKDLDGFKADLHSLCSLKKEKGIECIASMKINGHAGRVAIDNGEVVSASTRGRYKKGRNITEHLKVILHGDLLNNIAHLGFIELRGEIALKKERLHEAREFNSTIKSVFTAVSSLIRPYSTEEELSLLSFVCYDIYGDNIPEFKTLGEKFEYLDSLGFEVPIYTEHTIKPFVSFEDDIYAVVDCLGKYKEEFSYDTDGVVLSINNIEDFRSLGSENSTNKGNVALKIGAWQQEIYSSIIKEIVFCNGKSKITPKAVIEPVVVENGNTVRNVPLYNIAALELLEAYEGELIYFKYGGESGVIPCDSEGNVIGTLYSAVEIIEGH